MGIHAAADIGRRNADRNRHLDAVFGGDGDGGAVGSLEQMWKRLWAGDRAERAVVVEIERRGGRQSVTVQTGDRAKTLRRAQGI